MALIDHQAIVPVPTPQQQKVLDRILVQRERLRARRAAFRQARAVAAARESVEPGAPLLTRLTAFARLHPVAVAAVLGAAVVVGPRRVTRWAGVLLPLVLRARRG